MNTANKLTLLRIIMIPVIMAALYLEFPFHKIVALTVFILACVTDFIDGFVARSFNQVTDIGKFMDPLADKLLVISVMLYFVEAGQMAAWALLIVLTREFAVSGLRMVAAPKGIVIAAAWSGKIKTASTMVCICIMMLPVPQVWNTICVAVILITTVVSGVEYFIKNRKVFSKGAQEGNA